MNGTFDIESQCTNGNHIPISNTQFETMLKLIDGGAVALWGLHRHGTICQEYCTINSSLVPRPYPRLPGGVCGWGMRLH